MPPTMRAFVAVEPTDMRKSFTGLAGATRPVIEQDRMSGHLFVFFITTAALPLLHAQPAALVLALVTYGRHGAHRAVQTIYARVNGSPASEIPRHGPVRRVDVVSRVDRMHLSENKPEPRARWIRS